ncbi:MAG: LysR family transcriptional regulator [Deltaproteobacteria bacterium]|nr:LysR family transcriptional regulator [Deltaproteobacteria bacterium]
MSLLSAPLIAFMAIVKEQTVHSAAKTLGLTQTGVTQRIRALEATLSTTLFVRSRRGMMLTSEGQALLRYCQAASDLEGQALSRIQGAAYKSEVRVVITGPTSILRSRVIPQCVPVMKKAPGLLITFDLTDIEHRADALRRGTAQLAILPHHQISREMDSKLLKPERYILVAPKAWRKRPLADVIATERIIDFDPSDQMTLVYLSKFRLAEKARPERHFVNNTESLVELFMAGVGYGVLTAEFAKPHLAGGCLVALNSGAVYENRLALAWYPRPEMPKYFAELVAAVC